MSSLAPRCVVFVVTCLLPVQLVAGGLLVDDPWILKSSQRVRENVSFPHFFPFLTAFSPLHRRPFFLP